MKYHYSFEFAQQLDQEDELKSFREKFHIPLHNGKETLYFTGNSLGLQPKDTKNFINQELDVWATQAVDGHFSAPERPWLFYHKFSKPSLARLSGALEDEVVSMNNLTSNLHLMLVSFYRPSGKRTKILIEDGAFPSDYYAVESQLKFHGLPVEENLLELKSHKDEPILHHEDIITTIEENADELALVLLSGIQYYTGQLFNIREITKAAHKAGAKAGFDLAHAIGNIPLQLHDDDVDFAVWCSYKYLNSGPGGVAGIFVHQRYREDFNLPRFGGWWGHTEGKRFRMEKGFRPIPGADGWQLSNYNILSGAALLSSLQIFDQAGIKNLRQKSILLTGFLEFLIKEMDPYEKKIKIITPGKPEERGCQLSLMCKRNGRKLYEYLQQHGVVTDWREPQVIRIAPVPLYNTFTEVFSFVQLLKKALHEQG